MGTSTGVDVGLWISDFFITWNTEKAGKKIITGFVNFAGWKIIAKSTTWVNLAINKIWRFYNSSNWRFITNFTWKINIAIDKLTWIWFSAWVNYFFK